jgi:hypothetical protein
MPMSHYIEFDIDDNPRYLSKVGNWVITFLTPALVSCTQLAISFVIPTQHHNHQQVRRFVIQNTDNDQIWRVIAIEYDDHSSMQTLNLELESTLLTQFIQQLQNELRRYDVEIKYFHG